VLGTISVAGTFDGRTFIAISSGVPRHNMGTVDFRKWLESGLGVYVEQGPS
jgi:hypothetical protein